LDHPQAIRAIFFDAGFTLIRPYPSIPEMVAQIGAREGLTLDPAAIKVYQAQAQSHFAGARHVLAATWADNAAINAAWAEYFTELFAPFMPASQPDLLERCVAEALAMFDRHTAWQVFPEVMPTLATLRGRYTLGVISDWGVALGAILRDHDLSPYFDFLVVSATSRRAKPDPALFTLALERANALGQYTLYIGDTYVQDILGARAAGIHPILIDRRQVYDPAQLDCPVIHTLDELLPLLDLKE
jgi:HAD superfamily hydrolase (TIGR01549 family)